MLLIDIIKGVTRCNRYAVKTIVILYRNNTTNKHNYIVIIDINEQVNYRVLKDGDFPLCPSQSYQLNTKSKDPDGRCIK
jgi:hypothetical protein